MLWLPSIAAVGKIQYNTPFLSLAMEMMVTVSLSIVNHKYSQKSNIFALMAHTVMKAATSNPSNAFGELWPVKEGVYQGKDLFLSFKEKTKRIRFLHSAFIAKSAAFLMD